jgi:hypothetical protein
MNSRAERLRKRDMTDEEKPGYDSAPDCVEIKSADDALVMLSDGLREATRLFEEGKDAGRRGVIEALNVVSVFLSFFEDPNDYRRPFTNLINALLSLDKGKVTPLLTPVRRSGSPPATLMRESDIGLVAATVKSLADDGLDRNEAYERVAKVCREAGIKPGRGRNPQVTARTVRGWCEGVAVDVGRHSHTAQTFDIIMRKYQQVEGVDERAKRLLLLGGLREYFVKTRADER